jgi:acetylornithine aminotransferase
LTAFFLKRLGLFIPSKYIKYTLLNTSTQNHLIPTYNRLPITFSYGKGSWLYDKQKTPYLDVLSGISVTNLGHSHPKLINCLQEQSQKIWHTSNIYHIETQQKLADKLCKISGMKQAFFCNSGAEANEAAIKIARLYGNNKDIKNPAILTFENSFHGRTMATLTATGNPAVKKGFTPLLEGFYSAQLNDLESVKNQLEQHPNIVAIFVEPVQGEGGIIPATKEFLTDLQKITQEKNLLLMLDEIQSGVGRTGQWYAHQAANITCDVMTTAKALGNGFPIGACLVNNKALDIFSPGNHGSTFGGNPLACSVAYQVLEIIEQENILEKVKKNSEHFQHALNQLKNKHHFIQEIRISGLMIGIDINTDAIEVTKIVPQALENHLLINLTAGNTVRLLPPLNCTEEEIELAIERLEKTLLNS